MQPGVAYEPTAFMATALESNALRLENFNSSAFHLELKHRDTFSRGSHRNNCSGTGESGPQLPTERVLRKYREDALVVLVAMLARLGGKKGEPGLFTFASTPAQMILAMADEIDGTLQDQVA